MKHCDVLVTGANGYIGSHAVAALLERGARVVAVDLTDGAVDPRAEFVTADIFADGAARLLERCGVIPERVLHLAWRDGFVHNSVAHFEHLPEHYRFICELADAGVRQLAVMGTMHEIGFYHGAVDEFTPCAPLSLYGIAKNALRQALESRFRGGEQVFQWFRGFYLWGDDRRNHSIFSKLLDAAATGKREFPFTSGTRCYDFLSVAEFSRQLAAGVMQREVAGIINCCSGRATPIGEMVERFIAERGLPIRLGYGRFPDRPYDSPAIWGDNAKITAILEAESARQS